MTETTNLILKIFLWCCVINAAPALIVIIAVTRDILKRSKNLHPAPVGEKKEIPTGIVGLGAVILSVICLICVQWINAPAGIETFSDIGLFVVALAASLLLVGGIISLIGTFKDSGRGTGIAGFILAVLFILLTFVRSRTLIIISPAPALAIIIAVLRDVLKRHRKVDFAVAALTVVVSFLFFFSTGIVSYITYLACRDRKRSICFWLPFVALFSIAGYICFKIYDDAFQRNSRRHELAAAALVMTLFPFQPHLLILGSIGFWKLYGFYVLWLVFAILAAQLAVYLIYLLFRPALTNPAITVQSVTRRLLGKSASAEKDGPLLSVQNLRKYFPIRRGLFSRTADFVRAVDGINITVARGETLGLVGESGCGKTTTGRVVLNLLPKTSGKVIFNGIDLDALSPEEIRIFRREMQLIFQDPYGSLNPRMRIGNIIGEALSVHGIAEGKNYWQRRTFIRQRVKQILDNVGISPSHIDRYPHEFSGGQRQRIGIARAIALNPSFIVCDEPVSALDVSIQAQIINLLEDLQRQFNLSYLFIAHDLSVVEHISHRVAVMYLGLIVEEASSADLYRNPLHPYTRALMEAIPLPDPKTRRKKLILPGDVPSPVHPPAGCRFNPRCKSAMDRCSLDIPSYTEPEPGHRVACFLYD